MCVCVYIFIDKLHKYIDQKSIQEVYKAKAEKTAKAKGKKQQTKPYLPLRMIKRSGKYNQLKRDLTQDRHKPKKKESYKRKTLFYLRKNDLVPLFPNNPQQAHQDSPPNLLCVCVCIYIYIHTCNQFSRLWAIDASQNTKFQRRIINEKPPNAI